MRGKLRELKIENFTEMRSTHESARKIERNMFTRESALEFWELKSKNHILDTWMP